MRVLKWEEFIQCALAEGKPMNATKVRGTNESYEKI